MTTKRFVYAVEHGEYSDYGIDAIFSTRAIALRAAKAINDDDRIMTYEVYDEVPRQRIVYVKEWNSIKVIERSMAVWPWQEDSWLQGTVTNGIRFHEWRGGYLQVRQFRFSGYSKAKVHAAFDAYNEIDKGAPDR